MSRIVKVVEGNVGVNWPGGGWLRQRLRAEAAMKMQCQVGILVESGR